MATLTVMEHQRAVRFRDGRLDTVVGPGRHRFRRSRVSHLVVDLRPRFVTVPGQEVMTSDGVSVRVSVLARWRASEPATFVTAAVSSESELYALLQIATRHTIGARSAEQVLHGRAELGEAIAEVTAGLEPGRLGVVLDLVEVKDVMFPGEYRRALSQVVVAREEARASLERARGEVAAMRALSNAARLAHGNPELLQLRTLQAVGDGGNATFVVVPAGWTNAGPAAGADWAKPGVAAGGRDEDRSPS